MSKMKRCKVCSKEIASNAKSCPECGARNKKPIYKRLWFIVLILFLLIGVIGTMTSNDDSTMANNNTSETEDKTNDNESTNSTVPSEEIKDDTSIKEKPEEKIPTEYKSALKKAKVYSDTMHMSKAGLYEQLTSEYGEKFTAEAAQYAIDNIDANWNENALKKAKTYIDTMYMSKAGVYDQLISEYGERFTPEEAQYAIDNLE